MKNLIAKFALLAALVAAVAVPSLSSADGMMETTPAKKGMSVVLKAAEDPMGGYNLHLKTKKFKWAPEHVNQAKRKWEGHAHLYIDGAKITRLYGPDFYLGAFYLSSLEAGQHEVEVGLNANDHSTYVHRGVPVADTVTITVP
jgi:hypothetical protein